MHTHRLSLLILSTLLIASSPAYSTTEPTAKLDPTPNKTLLAQQAPAPDLITVGASLLNSLLNPPSRSAQINADAEVKKAKIAADADIAKEKLRIEASQNIDRVAPVLNQWGVARIACAPGLVFINGITTDTVCIQPSTDINPGYYSYDSARQQLIRNSASVQTTQNIQQTRGANNSDRGF
jgi:hypothetical protein